MQVLKEQLAQLNKALLFNMLGIEPLSPETKAGVANAIQIIQEQINALENEQA